MGKGWRVYVALVALFAALTACSSGSSGSSSGSSGQGGAVEINQAVVVEPYIVGATFFEDTNGNGRWDAGEQISTTSDAEGRLSFAKPVAAGSLLVMREGGYRQGLPFTGMLLYRVGEEAADPVIFSPLTTLAALGFSGNDISSLLSPLNGYQTYDLNIDPMAGLAELTGPVSDDALVDLRANLYVGALLDLFLVGRDYDEFNGQALVSSGGQLLAGLQEGLRYATEPAARNDIEALLPEGYDLPPVSMREVAETLPAILNWWKQELIRKALQGEPLEVSANDFKALVDAEQPQLGLHYYLHRHQKNEIVINAIADELLSQIETAYVAINRFNNVEPVEPIYHGALVGQVFELGEDSQLRFLSSDNGVGGNVELTLGNGQRFTGSWRVEEEVDSPGLAVLILKDEDEGASLKLELEANRSSHLALRIRERDEAYDAEKFIGRLLQKTDNFQVI
ncbi:hypothetical protein [Desulfurivibrio alkaliphilus]|uniref:Uncharacterized protein n=1 Tax=Desulfurivibrio alkaliphilus (strain DSM 19089 / UNIQEM U267 / AHT2) TaxID=589865 RepID=D6Z4J4_DESAT|nr:hypothetical protein [Desulfurivibrio alkaliphilus]ADH86469.1 hypothetical protein DaAHT2_1778 [Desulfurivibrio alkaliphilus AHT 2]